MGFNPFKSVKKLGKKIFDGVGKVFKKVFKPFAKVLGNKWIKYAIMGVSLVTGVGAMVSAATSGFAAGGVSGALGNVGKMVANNVAKIVTKPAELLGQGLTKAGDTFGSATLQNLGGTLSEGVANLQGGIDNIFNYTTGTPGTEIASNTANNVQVDSNVANLGGAPQEQVVTTAGTPNQGAVIPDKSSLLTRPQTTNIDQNLTGGSAADQLIENQLEAATSQPMTPGVDLTEGLDAKSLSQISGANQAAGQAQTVSDLLKERKFFRAATEAGSNAVDFVNDNSGLFNVLATGFSSMLTDDPAEQWEKIQKERDKMWRGFDYEGTGEGAREMMGAFGKAVGKRNSFQPSQRPILNRSAA